MTLRRAVDRTNLIARSPTVVAHLLKTGSVEKAGNTDKANGPVAGCRMVIKDFPRRPSPEIDVKIAKMLRMHTHAPIFRRNPRKKRRFFLDIAAAVLHPSAVTFRLLLVGRISDYDGDRNVSFDCGCLFSRSGDRLVHRREPAFVDVRIRKSIGDEHAQL